MCFKKNLDFLAYIDLINLAYATHLLSACFCLVILTGTKAQQPVNAVNQFINTLNKEQKAETVFPFDIEERYNFHFVPKERKGITFNEMNEEQKKAAISLMKTCLSEQAFQKSQRDHGS
jgi:hypothetical protein